MEAKHDANRRAKTRDRADAAPVRLEIPRIPEDARRRLLEEVAEFEKAFGELTPDELANDPIERLIGIIDDPDFPQADEFERALYGGSSGGRTCSS